VPIPWSGTAPPYGFSPDAATAPPWLPQPDSWAPLTVAAQEHDPDSTLSLYRAALRLRHEQPALGDGTLRWLDTPDGVLGFVRDPGFGALVNFSAESAMLPEGATVLLASSALEGDGRVGTDTAAWFRSA
jgi:alpha-glucosidase